MTIIQPVATQCPLCGHAFEVQLLIRMNEPVAQESDFRYRPPGFDPLTIEAAQCPACGYSDLVSAWVEGRALSNEQKAQLRALLSEPGVFDQSPADLFAAVARNNAIVRDGLEIKGSVYLRAAWCSADAQDYVAEANYRRRTIECYRAAVEQGPGDPPRSYLLISYLVGELYRRVGDDASARQWFDRAIALGERAPSRDWIVSLALRQRDDPRDQL